MVEKLWGTARTPGRVAHVHTLLVPVVELAEEKRPEVVRARSRNGLHAGDALLGHHGGVLAKHQARGSGRVLRQTGDWEVFVVDGRVIDEQFGRLAVTSA